MAVTTCANPPCTTLIGQTREFCHRCWMRLTFEARGELNVLRSNHTATLAYRAALADALDYLAGGAPHPDRPREPFTRIYT